MAEKDRPLTEEEKEAKRNVALANLYDNGISDLALGHYTQARTFGDYGADGQNAVDVVYDNRLNSPTEGVSAISAQLLRESRESGKIGTGSVSEGQLRHRAAVITEESIVSLRVEDVAGLIGYTGKVDPNYAKSYIGDLVDSSDPDAKALGVFLLQNLSLARIQKGVSKAIDESANEVQGGLEKVLSGDAKLAFK